MSLSPLRTAALLALLALPLATSCRAPEPGPPDSPETTALALFRLAADDDPPAERVDALFGADDDERRRAALFDALAGLARVGTPSVLEVQPLDDGRRSIVDLESALAGGGSARYSVQTENDDAGWRVTWFQGPGVEWPPPRPRRDAGLTTSPAPQRVNPPR